MTTAVVVGGWTWWGWSWASLAWDGTYPTHLPPLRCPVPGSCHAAWCAASVVGSSWRRTTVACTGTYPRRSCSSIVASGWCWLWSWGYRDWLPPRCSSWLGWWSAGHTAACRTWKHQRARWQRTAVRNSRSSPCSAESLISGRSRESDSRHGGGRRVLEDRTAQGPCWSCCCRYVAGDSWRTPPDSQDSAPGAQDAAGAATSAWGPHEQGVLWGDTLWGSVFGGSTCCGSGKVLAGRGRRLTDDAPYEASSSPGWQRLQPPGREQRFGHKTAVSHVERPAGNADSGSLTWERGIGSLSWHQLLQCSIGWM